MPESNASQLTATAPARQYGELILYAVLFFALVASVFVLNIILSTQSQKDATQIFCATRQQRAWQKARKNLENAQIAVAAGAPVAAALAEFNGAIKNFDAVTRALHTGGTLTLDATTITLERIEDARAARIIDTLYAIWSKGREPLLQLATGAALRDKTINDSLAAIGSAAEFVVGNDDAVFNGTQEFIVKLGELSTERTARLQTLQVVSLVSSILVFLFMVFRVSFSLRKQDGIISERTEEIIAQRDTIAQEKVFIEKLLSDLKETQTQLIQSEKMASLGQMVAGLAHEVNTPLGFVKNNIQVTERNHAIISDALDAYMKLGDTIESGELEHLEKVLLNAKAAAEKIRTFDLISKTKKILASSVVGAERIQELISNLKNFSRLDETSVKNADINAGIDSALMIAENVIKQKADVVKHYAPSVTAECYPAQLNQVFLNLLTNAAQAIPDGTRGTITITTRLENNNVILNFADTGKGIAPENLKKIFEPFFTTKPIGQGTGLGLSIVYKIIERHQGSIDVKSDVGKGTEFEIRIPRKLSANAQPQSRAALA